jgi:hypothetical protein
MRLSSFTVLALAVLVGSACATTTKITSEPPGAIVTSEKDNTVLGKTPLTYESKMWIWESEKLKVTAPGKKPKVVEVKRSEVDAAPLIGGICLSLIPPCYCVQGVPLILAGGFKFPEVTPVKLENDPNAGMPPPAALLESAPPESAPTLATAY